MLEMDDMDSNLPPNAALGRLPEIHSHGLLEGPEAVQATSASDEPFVKSTDHPDKEKVNRFFGFSNTLRPQLSPIDGPTATAELVKRRYIIRRQLRLLFIYPLVYALMWVPPLISHSLQYTDYFAENPSFPLLCLVSFTLPIQCAVDCWLFATREKPWKYIPHTGRRTFWFSFVFWKHECGQDHDGARCPQAVEDEEELRQEVWRSTTRRSLSIEQRAAYARLESERKELEKNRLGRRKEASGDLARIPEEGEVVERGQRKGSVGSTRTVTTGGLTAGKPAGEMSWWDKEDIEEGLDEEEEDEGLRRGRKHNVEILNALQAGHTLSTDNTVRDDSSTSVKRYGCGVASGSGSRSVSLSAATSTTKRDSGSVAEETIHSGYASGNGSGWGGSTPVGVTPDS